DDARLCCYKSADQGKGFGESSEININPVMAPQMRSRARAICTHRSHTVGIVDEQAERESFLESDHLFQYSQIPGHSESAFRYHEDRRIWLGIAMSPFQLLCKTVYIIMFKNKLFCHGQL